jgi:outer membrane receptor protein involved in Fe transport
LKVEKISGYEVGYKGVFGNVLFVTLDGYFNVLKDFITDLAPGTHPLYPQPAVLPEDPLGYLRGIWSYTNAGKVHEKGMELGINYYLTDSWILDANYAFFDFSVFEKAASDVLLPNAPKHKINGGITYRSIGGYQIGLSMKYVPTFDWAAGIFQGPILAYTLVNLSASYQFSEHLQFGLNITNLLDREHYEIFGGSFIRRRAMLSTTATF